MVEPQMTDDLLVPPCLDPEVRFHDRIHKSFLHPGIVSNDLRLKWELPELQFPEDRLTVPVLRDRLL